MLLLFMDEAAACVVFASSVSSCSLLQIVKKILMMILHYKNPGKIEIYILVSVPLDKPGSAMWRLGQYAQFVWQYTIYKCMSMWNALLYAIVEGDQTQSNVAKPDIDHTTPKY